VYAYIESGWAVGILGKGFIELRGRDYEMHSSNYQENPKLKDLTKQYYSNEHNDSHSCTSANSASPL